LFTAEQAFFAQYNQYYGAFDSIGFAISGNAGYNVGFPAVGAAAPLGAPAGTPTCFHACAANGLAPAACMANYATWTCNNLNGTYPGMAAAAVAPAVGPPALFTAGAIAKLNPNAAAATYDQWTMNENQVLSNTISGL
jgi:hypothetical protein